MISALPSTLASKSISTDVRGNVSINWAEYTAPAKVTGFSSVPGSNITAEVVTVDGLTISQTDSVGITSGLVAQDITTVVDGAEQTTSLYRRHTATGMEIRQRDGRGNVSTTVTDIAGRVISSTDAAGNMTFTAYDAVHDKPSVITNAQGFTSCYKYDARGRKIAEWGSALQPACFGYDEMDNMVTLSTFRAGDETITTDPSERTDKDTTTWTFHPLTGAELSKTYADNTSVTKTYDAYNRLATETDARGNVKTHSYEQLRGLHIGTTYSDGTTARSYSYNHLGQPTQVTDDSGTRMFGHNAYGERISDSLVIDGDTHLITESLDAMGRSTGFVYSKNGTAQHTVTSGYGTDGRINSAGFLHGGAEKVFGYEYLSGSNLLHRLTKPNGMTLTQSYEEHRNLLTGMAYHRGTTLVAQREYVYDTLDRPTARNTARKGTVVNDTFAHNTRSELTAAQMNGENYQYNYDNIGNRTTATEGDESTTYTANALNQYTAIQENAEAAFTPLFDADGNQTRIKTETGIWEVIYNAENRPVSFTNAESNTVVECAYDSMGRRAYKKVTVNGNITLHQRYIYRGYLQIAALDLTRSAHPALWFITWDPTQPIATRPLSIRINGTWYTFGWDLTKNICELYSTGGGISTSYTYTPFGKVTSSGSITQPIQWSSEYKDDELSVVYYNWRYYCYLYTKWNSKDLISNQNMYIYCDNSINKTDYIGLSTVIYTFFIEDKDADTYNRLLNETSSHNRNISQKADEISKGIENLKEKTKYCRGNMEFFEWLRNQGGEILWNDKEFSGSFEEFIDRLKKDTASVINVRLNKSESIEDLKSRLNESVEKYDKIAIIGHSIFQTDSTEAYFRIPVINGEPFLVKHDFFSSPFELITCFMNDSFPRSWKIKPGNGGIALDIKQNSQSGCSHLKNGKIFYNEFDIYAVIFNPPVPSIDYSPIDISID